MAGFPLALGWPGLARRTQGVVVRLMPCRSFTSQVYCSLPTV